MNIIKKILNVYMRYLAPPIKYARYLGVEVGDNCLITTRNWSTEPYLVKIGNNVQITNNVTIHTHGGGNCIRMNHPDFDVFGRVVIEDWAYIGAYSHIMPGVTIGEGALVAAASVVTKSVEPHTVVAGNPARYICTTEEYYQKNQKYDLHTKQLDSLQKKKVILDSSKEKLISK